MGIIWAVFGILEDILILCLLLGYLLTVKAKRYYKMNQGQESESATIVSRAWLLAIIAVLGVNMASVLGAAFYVGSFVQDAAQNKRHMEEMQVQMDKLIADTYTLKERQAVVDNNIQYIKESMDRILRAVR